MADASLRGRFLWHELLTSDPAAGEAFYTALVGYGTMTMDPGSGPYTMLTMGEEPRAGLMELPEEAKKMGAPPHWLLYVGAPDVDATVAQATSLGGASLHEPFDVPTVGRFGIIADPQGAALGVYTPAEGPPPEQEPGLGGFAWHELATSDYEAAFGFYEQLFGWEKTEAMDMGEGDMYQMYGRNATDSLGGMFNTPAEMPGPPAWLLYIEVADADAAAAKASELGGQVLNGPMDVPGGGRIVQLLDPQGVAFAVHAAASG